MAFQSIGKFIPHLPKNTGPLPERRMLDEAEAREIYNSYLHNQNRDFVKARLARAEVLYGKGSAERIRFIMNQLRTKELK